MNEGVVKTSASSSPAGILASKEHPNWSLVRRLSRTWGKELSLRRHTTLRCSTVDTLPSNRNSHTACLSLFARGEGYKTRVLQQHPLRKLSRGGTDCSARHPVHRSGRADFPNWCRVRRQVRAGCRHCRTCTN